MLVIKVIGLVACIVVARRYKQARLALVIMALLGTLLLRGLQCGYDWATDPHHRGIPAGAAGDILSPFSPKKPINPYDCPDPKNCIPPPPTVNASP